MSRPGLDADEASIRPGTEDDSENPSMICAFAAVKGYMFDADYRVNWID